LITPIPDHAYLALAPADMDLNARRKLLLRAWPCNRPATPCWAGKLEASWKLHPQVAEHLRQAAAAAPKAGVGTRRRRWISRAITCRSLTTGAEKAVRVKMRQLCRAL